MHVLLISYSCPDNPLNLFPTLIFHARKNKVFVFFVLNFMFLNLWKVPNLPHRRRTQWRTLVKVGIPAFTLLLSIHGLYYCNTAVFRWPRRASNFRLKFYKLSGSILKLFTSHIVVTNFSYIQISNKRCVWPISMVRLARFNVASS
jgi:hypothetical protein